MYINVNNISIHYKVIGQGKSIILFNPISVDTSAMKYIVKELSRAFLKI